jgi:hypothetical protein
LTKKEPFPGIKKFLDAFSLDPKKGLTWASRSFWMKFPLTEKGPYPLIKYCLDEFSFDQKQALPWHQELFVV